MRKLLIILVGLIVFSSLGLHLYYNVYNKAYKDKEYGFLLLNTRGWRILPPNEEVHLSLGTEKDGKVISFVGFSPLYKNANKNKDAGTLRKLCEDLVSKNGFTFVNFKEVGIGNLKGYTCNYEMFGTNLNKTLMVSSITLLGNTSDDYDYVITASFPRNDQEEQKKVETLIYSFWVN